MLSKSFLKKIREKLLNERQGLLAKSSQRPDIDTEGDETDEIQAHILIDLQNQLNGRDQIKLSHINDSLKRLDDKTYGVCVDCGEDIPEKRLLHNPYFLTCVSCAEEREAEDRKRS